MSGIYKDDSWSIGEAQVNGLPTIVRARTHLPSVADRELHPHLIIISWPYQATVGGMPTPEESQEMNQFEDALESSIESKVGIQAASITGNRNKEWRYYTYDKDQFMSELNSGLANHKPYPVQITLYADPEWDALAELLPART